MKASNFLGQYYFHKGDFANSQESFNKTVSYLNRGKFSPSMTNFSMLCEAMAKILRNDQDIITHNLLDLYSKIKLKVWQGMSMGIMGNILLNLNGAENPETENWIKKAIKSDEKNGLKWHLANDHATYAKFFKKKGDKSKARENLVTAINCFNECGADGWVSKFEKELSSLS